VIYANDNRGRWRSEFSEIVRLSAASGPTGEAIARVLRPADTDYAVLKPKHSAFFATPLDLLLRHLRTQRLIVTGVASDLCVTMTASEARMRDYEVAVPGDCVAALTPQRNDRALRFLAEVHGMETTPSTELSL
jgi:nicotinamidase-related amidase